MPSITEGALTFHFPDGWQATKFDTWSFYRNQFQRVCGGTKAIDILAIDSDSRLWAIEVKDYREHPRAKTIDLADEVARKVCDSLAALVAASVNANDTDEKELSRAALACNRIRVVLHLEQPKHHSKLFPRVYNLANVTQNLKQLIKAIDPHPRVMETGSLGNPGWSVT